MLCGQGRGSGLTRESCWMAIMARNAWRRSFPIATPWTDRVFMPSRALAMAAGSVVKGSRTLSPRSWLTSMTRSPGRSWVVRNSRSCPRARVRLAGREGGGRGGRGGRGVDRLEVRDLDRLAVLEDLEVPFAQVVDPVAGLVRGPDLDVDDVDLHHLAEARRLRLRRRLGGQRRCGEGQQENETYGAEFHELLLKDDGAPLPWSCPRSCGLPWSRSPSSSVGSFSGALLSPPRGVCRPRPAVPPPPPQSSARNWKTSSPGVAGTPSLTCSTALRPGTPDSEFTSTVRAPRARCTSSRRSSAKSWAGREMLKGQGSGLTGSDTDASWTVMISRNACWRWRSCEPPWADIPSTAVSAAPMAAASEV